MEKKWFPINSQKQFEVAAAYYTAGTAASHHLLTHPLKDPWPVLNSCTRCWSASWLPDPLVSKGSQKWDSWGGPKGRRQGGPSQGTAVARRRPPPHPRAQLTNPAITKFGVQMIFPSMRQTGRGHHRAGDIQAGCLLSQSQYWHRFPYGDVFDHMFPISHCSSLTPLNPLKFAEAIPLHTVGYVMSISKRTNEIYRITSN